MPGARAAVILLLATLSISLSQAEDKGTVTLTQAIATAIAQGPDAQLNANALATAQQVYNQAAGANGIGLGLQGSGSHDSNRQASTSNPLYPKNPYDTAGASLAITAPNASASVTAGHQISEQTTPLQQATSIQASGSVTVFDGYGVGPWGKPAAAVQQAGLTLQGKRLTSRSGLQTIVVNVAQAWWAVLQAQYNVALQQQSLTQQQGALAQVQAQYDNGLASQLNLRQAQVDEQTQVQTLAKAQSDLASAKQSMAVLLGWPVDTGFTAAEAAEPQVPGLEPSALLSTAYANRADLTQLQLSIQNANIQLGLARTLARPTVSVNGGYTYSYDWVAGANTTSWNVGANASLSLYDSGVIASQVRQAELALATLQTQQQQLRQSIAAAVQSGAANVGNLAALDSLAQSNLDLANSQEQLARTNLEQGVGSQLDVLSAVVRTAGAQLALQQARANLAIGILNLQNTLGTVEVPTAGQAGK